VEAEKGRTKSRSKKTVPIMPTSFTMLLHRFSMKHTQNHFAILVGIYLLILGTDTIKISRLPLSVTYSTHQDITLICNFTMLMDVERKILYEDIGYLHKI
jgi:hypothetical protein